MKNPFRAIGDLLVVVTWTFFAVAAVLSGVAPSPLRTVLTLPLVLLFPGYALLAFLFPERAETGAGVDGGGGADITTVERFALSVAASLAFVPMTAFVLNYASSGIRLRPLLLAVGGATIVLASLGYVRRLRLPVRRRHHVPLGSWVGAAAGQFLSADRSDLRNAPPLKPTTGGQRFLNLVFVASLLVLAATAGYAAVTPPSNDEPFTEFYLLTQTDDGEFVAEDLPHEFSQGESRSLYVAIGNQEGQSVPYTVVVTLDGEEIDRFGVAVDDGETERIERSVTPTKSGDRLELSFLLYRGDVPDQPTAENAYRETHLWVSVGGG